MDDDKTSSATYNIAKLNENNYRTWAHQIEAVLDDKELWEVVSGTEREPTAPTATTAAEGAGTPPSTTATAEYVKQLALYTKKVKKARAIILSSITGSVMTYIEGIKDPAKMWSTLEGKYNPKTQTTLIQMMKEFMSMKMDESEDVEQHLQKVIALKKRLEEQGEKVSNNIYNGVLLTSMPDTYKTTVRILEASGRLTPQAIIDGILEESRRIGKEDAIKMKMVLLTKQSQSKSSRRKKGTQPQNNNECSHCGRKGHTDVKCWIKHPELRPSRGSDSKSPKFTMMAVGRHSENVAPEK